jgi:hypothetical protein
VLEWEWTFDAGGSSLREQIDPLLGGSPYASFRANRRVVTLGLDRLLDWLSAPGGFGLLALGDPRGFQAWVGWSVAVTRVGRGRSPRSTPRPVR